LILLARASSNLTELLFLFGLSEWASLDWFRMTLYNKSIHLQQVCVRVHWYIFCGRACNLIKWLKLRKSDFKTEASRTSHSHGRRPWGATVCIFSVGSKLSSLGIACSPSLLCNYNTCPAGLYLLPGSCRTVQVLGQFPAAEYMLAYMQLEPYV
jgi:hypothetical protein